MSQQYNRICITAYWCALKWCSKHMIGTAVQMVTSYLDEHMWRKWYRCTSTLAFINLVKHITEPHICWHKVTANYDASWNQPFSEPPTFYRWTHV